MVEIQDVLEYISRFYELAMDRPETCAADPEALEEVLIAMERLRFFIVTGQDPQSELPYFQFLRSEGFDAAAFVIRMRETISDNAVLFQELRDFFARYLASRQ